MEWKFLMNLVTVNAIVHQNPHLEVVTQEEQLLQHILNHHRHQGKGSEKRPQEN